MAVDPGTDCAEGRRRLAAKPEERLMPNTLQEQLERVERDILLYLEFDEIEKARFDRESYLWTAEDRIEWQETQFGNAEQLHRLLREREALRRNLSQ